MVTRARDKLSGSIPELQQRAAQLAMIAFGRQGDTVFEQSVAFFLTEFFLTEFFLTGFFLTGFFVPVLIMPADSQPWLRVGQQTMSDIVGQACRQGDPH